MNHRRCFVFIKIQQHPVRYKANKVYDIVLHTSQDRDLFLSGYSFSLRLTMENNPPFWWITSMSSTFAIQYTVGK